MESVFDTLGDICEYLERLPEWVWDVIPVRRQQARVEGLHEDFGQALFGGGAPDLAGRCQVLQDAHEVADGEGPPRHGRCQLNAFATLHLFKAQDEVRGFGYRRGEPARAEIGGFGDSSLSENGVAEFIHGSIHQAVRTGAGNRDGGSFEISTKQELPDRGPANIACAHQKYPHHPTFHRILHRISLYTMLDVRVHLASVRIQELSALSIGGDVCGAI